MSVETDVFDISSAIEVSIVKMQKPGEFWVYAKPGTSYEEEMDVVKRAIDATTRTCNRSSYVSMDVQFPRPGKVVGVCFKDSSQVFPAYSIFVHQRKAEYCLEVLMLNSGQILEVSCSDVENMPIKLNIQSRYKYVVIYGIIPDGETMCDRTVWNNSSYVLVSHLIQLAKTAYVVPYSISVMEEVECIYGDIFLIINNEPVNLKQILLQKRYEIVNEKRSERQDVINDTVADNTKVERRSIFDLLRSKSETSFYSESDTTESSLSQMQRLIPKGKSTFETKEVKSRSYEQLDSISKIQTFVPTSAQSSQMSPCSALEKLQSLGNKAEKSSLCELLEMMCRSQSQNYKTDSRSTSPSIPIIDEYSSESEDEDYFGFEMVSPRSEQPFPNENLDDSFDENYPIVQNSNLKELEDSNSLNEEVSTNCAGQAKDRTSNQSSPQDPLYEDNTKIDLSKPENIHIREKLVSLFSSDQE